MWRAFQTFVRVFIHLSAICFTGCFSPHGGFRLPFSGEPKQQIYGGDGHSFETALRVRRVKEGGLEYIENGWLHDHYGDILKRNEFEQTIRRKTERFGKRIYHIVSFTDRNGKADCVYFDITNIVDD